MKIIKVIFLGVMALGLIVSAGIFIFLEIFDADAYLPQISRQASTVLGRPVTIGHLGLGFSWQGITLDAGPVVIADDAAISRRPFVKVNSVHLGLDIVSLIIHREIRVTDVLLQSPEIHIIIPQGGSLNVRSIGQKSPAAGNRNGFGLNPRADNPSSQMEVRSASRAVTPAFPIKSIKIRDASISFIDQNQTMPLDIWVSDINAAIDDFSLTKPFRLSLEASALSDVPNVHVSAVMSLNLSKPSVLISDLTFHTDLARLDPGEVKGLTPLLARISWPGHITGIISIHLSHLEAGANGAFTASGDAVLTDAVIENFNIAKMALAHTLGTIPGLFELADKFFNGALNNKLGGDNTIIEKLEAQFSIHDSVVFIEDALLQTKIFDFTAQGSMDAGLNTSLQTMLRLDGDVSAVLKGKVRMLEFLCDDNGRIAIPARITGVFPHLEYKPDKDFRKKAKKAFMKEGPKQIINDVLNNFLQ